MPGEAELVAGSWVVEAGAPVEEEAGPAVEDTGAAVEDTGGRGVVAEPPPVQSSWPLKEIARRLGSSWPA